MKPIEFRVEEDRAGLRLDQAISARCPDVSRTQARKAIAAGGVFVDSHRVKVASRIPRVGQLVTVNLAGIAVVSQQAPTQAAPISILAETDSYLIIDKPSGMFSAPTPETDQNDLLYFLARERATKGRAVSAPLHLVHRLDRPTSGLMVLAKSSRAAASLGEQLQSHTMERRYQAIVVGSLAQDVTIDTPIEGKAARTHFRVIEQKSQACWVSARLETGRTHQVRVHAEAMGAPVAGDSKYGRRAARTLQVRAPRLALHAVELCFSDPDSGERRTFQCPWPKELSDYWAMLS